MIGGLLLYDLVGHAVNLHTRSMIGTPASVYNERETALTGGFFTQRFEYDFTVDRVSFSPAGVPEPSAWSLMILGFAGLGTAFSAAAG